MLTLKGYFSNSLDKLGPTSWDSKFPYSYGTTYWSVPTFIVWIEYVQLFFVVLKIPTSSFAHTCPLCLSHFTWMLFHFRSWWTTLFWCKYCMAFATCNMMSIVLKSSNGPSWVPLFSNLLCFNHWIFASINWQKSPSINSVTREQLWVSLAKYWGETSSQGEMLLVE